MKATKQKAIRTIIIDDEPAARKRIRDLLQKQADFEIVAECSSGEEAIESISTNSPDLIFLDVQMGSMDGFDVLSTLGKGNLPITIFVTAYDKYALQAFRVHALDYLLKPFDDERFGEMIEFVRHQIGRNRIGDLNDKLGSFLDDHHKNKETRTFQTRLVLKSNGRISFIPVESIDWITAEDSYVSINAAGRSHLMRESLSNLEHTLNPDTFLRIHRSTIINVTRIKELHPSFHGEYVVVLSDGKRFKLSRNYRDGARRLIAGEF